MITPVEERIVGARNLGLHVRIWRPQQAPRAVVVICHGVNSHSGYYQWAADQLVPAGFAVYALDLHGRGRSDGERFYLQAMGDYVQDVDCTVEFAKSREPGLPVFLFGHSAGGVVSSTYCLDHQQKLAGFICESFAFQVAAPDFALAAVRGLAHLAPHAHVLRLKFEDFSRDPAAVKAMHDDPLIKDEVQPTQTVAELARADERLKTSFPQITLPLLIMHGAADKVTRPGGSKFFHETAGSKDKTLKLYEGHAHDLLNDFDREVVIADVIAWLKARGK